MTAHWTAPTGTPEAYARAGGRRRINALRHQARVQRRALLLCFDLVPWHGLQAALARHFGVNRSTICKDLKALRDGTYVPEKLRGGG